jgi:hypothetical protein
MAKPTSIVNRRHPAAKSRPPQNRKTAKPKYHKYTLTTHKPLLPIDLYYL